MLLPDCVLFPHGGLPLYIFEERYRAMLDDAIAGSCCFAVARLTDEETHPPLDCAAQVGTIGLVRASREGDDGTSQLLLHGVMRVRFVRWLDEKDYPYAEIEPLISHFADESQKDAAMKTLIGAVEDTVKVLPKPVQDGIFGLLNRADDPALLTDIVSQQFIQNADLRLKLLEELDVGRRVTMLCEALAELKFEPEE